MQPTKKISQLPQQSTPTTSDKAPIVSGGITDYVLLSDLITLFSNNIPAGAHSDVTRGSETGFDFIVRLTGVWTADSAGVNRNASMTAATCYINGRRISINAVSARTFTASVDTYVDVLDNGDGTGTLVYTTAANNAASPALAANSVRVAIIVTGATFIAAATSVNQGQEDMVLPIASSIPYAVTDSLGNLICPRDPARSIIGYRQILANFTTASASQVQITGLTVPCIVPLGRKVEVWLHCPANSENTASRAPNVAIYDGVVGGGVQLQTGSDFIETSGTGVIQTIFVVKTPTTASKTYNAATAGLGGGTPTTTVGASSTSPAFLQVRLV